MSTKRTIGFGLLALLMLGGAGLAYLTWAGIPLGKLSELISQGPITRLDPSPEVHRGGSRVLLFALDGVGDAVFHNALHAGQMPHVGALMGDRRDGDGRLREHAWIIPNAMSILPSTTVAAWTSTFTGKPAGETGVTGNEWFAREEMRFFAPAPVSVHGNEDTLRALNEGLIGNVARVPTLFERIRGRSHVSLMPVYRGADIYTVPDPDGLAQLFGAVAAGIVAGAEEATVEAYAAIDRGSVDSIVQAVQEHGLPTLQVVYFPGIDLFSHVAERPLEHQPEYLSEVIDPAIERVVSLYRDRNELENTWIVFVSDHGHTPVIDDDAHSLGVGGSEDTDEPTAVLLQQGFRVRPFEVETDVVDYQAVVAYQGAIAYVYLADRSTCPAPGQRCDWHRAPRYEEDVLPVVRGFHAATSGGPGGLANALDCIFSRQPQPVGTDALPFQAWNGTALVPIQSWLDSESRTDLLELSERMRLLSAGPEGHRAGDVLLLARSGVDRPISERHYFSGPYRSWHGSPEASDSTITFAVAQPNHTGTQIRSLVRRVAGEHPSQLDVTDVVLALAQQ